MSTPAASDPVLYVSGHTDDAVDLSALEDTQMSFLAKPFTPDGIARAAREAVGQAAAR